MVVAAASGRGGGGDVDRPSNAATPLLSSKESTE